MNSTKSQEKAKWWQVVLSIPLGLLLVVVLVLCLAFSLASTILVNLAVWASWCVRGREILFVYSDSPIWRDYIEERLLPRFGERSLVLNWSQRRKWRFSLARIVFSHFGGRRAFNPLAVVFRPFRPTRTFRFWQPFQDFKHGKPEALHQMESDFFDLIGVERTANGDKC
jgi:hypothetical protein